MRYLLINKSHSNLQIDLLNPDPHYSYRNLHRPGPVVALKLHAGEARDILPHFGGDFAKAHASITHSKDVIKNVRPDRVHIMLLDDDNNELDIKEYLAGKAVAKSQPAPIETMAPASPSDHMIPVAEPVGQPIETVEEPIMSDTAASFSPQLLQTELLITKLSPDIDVLGLHKNHTKKLRAVGITSVLGLVDANVDVVMKAVGTNKAEEFIGIAKNWCERNKHE